MISTQNQLLNNYFKEYFNKKFVPEITLKREDQIHPFVSGNKFRKLKYNLIEAKNQQKNSLLTFGGAYSNHIAATAAAGKELGFKTLGIIRGEELFDKIDENPTLAFAKANGMTFHFVNREQYKQKNTNEFQNTLTEIFGDFYLIPEGGTNLLAIKGCEEILTEEDTDFDYICLPVGTGGTMAGIVNSSKPHQKILGFSALKGDFLENEIKKWTSKTNWEITDAYCFEGYAKINGELVNFINEFKNTTGIPLDPIYTGKMIYGIFELVKTGFFSKNSRILAIHTGGLQGIQGMNLQLKKRNLPLIKI
ncbi:MAG: pyridoxal-phosphate dependent enzyme [Flavobacteriaceae bacterium]|nr:pyridoxal-phosphate dependent enzyme [Flavobacteriaceae bacterium]